MHDLRNPLNAISIAAEVLRRACAGVPNTSAALDVITRQVRVLASRIDTLGGATDP